jgi:ketosteroid isomerase-like protein
LDRSDEVLAINEAFYNAFNHHDTELMARLWANSDDVTCIHPGWNVLQGREDVLNSWRRILENPNQARVVTGGASVVFLDDVAIVICRELVAGSPLIATNIFINEDGDWKIVHHQSGPVMAGA